VPAGGAEHERHSVRDAQTDGEQAEQRRGRVADQEHRGERDPSHERPEAQKRHRAGVAIGPVAEDTPDRHPAREACEGERRQRGLGAEVLT
jgi:hypothetical protein